MSSSNGNEAEVVLTADLGPILLELATKHASDHPTQHQTQNRTRSSEHHVSHVGHYQWMEFDTGVSRTRLYLIATQRQRYVTLSMADKILNGLELTHLLGNGTIPVIPNPQWSRERWAEYMAERSACD